MRPQHDITCPEADPTETVHFLRNSNNEWQATAERLARQRDAAAAERDKLVDTLIEIVATPASEFTGAGRDRVAIVNGHRKVVALAQAALDEIGAA